MGELTSRSFDVVVIGAGAAGLAAARAASESHVRVALIDGGPGATARASGWIAAHQVTHAADELGWLASVGLLAPGSYRFVTTAGCCVEAVSGAVSLLDVASLATARAAEAPLGVVDLFAGAGWSAPWIASTLRDTLGVPTCVLDATSLGILGDRAIGVSHALDTDGIVDAIANALRASARECRAVLFPPVLGLAREDVASRLQARLGVAVGECGGDDGDSPGVRVAAALSRAVDRDVLRITSLATVEGTDDAVDIHVEGQRLRATSVVLATGGLAGGGIAFDGLLREPCAQSDVWFADEPSARAYASLPVPSAERGMDPVPIFEIDARLRTRANSVGVRIDANARVIGHDGTAARAPWLFAAGGVVAGGRGPYGPGIADALCAGALAGRRAAGYARDRGDR